MAQFIYRPFSGEARSWSAQDGTRPEETFFDGVITCYVYYSLRIVTNNLNY